MAWHEFRLSERDASRHTWTTQSSGPQRTCCRCGLVAEEQGGVLCEVYPAHRVVACHEALGPSATAELKPAPVTSVDAATFACVVEAEVRNMRLRFTGASQPAFIAAVLGALEGSSP
jgi:hypothetical protein